MDLVPPEMKAGALGLHGLVTGAMAFLANALAGWLWMRFGSMVPFIVGGVMAWVAAALLLARPRPASHP